MSKQAKTQKQSNLQLTGLANFFNNYYLASEICNGGEESMRVKFKPSPRKTLEKKRDAESDKEKVERYNRALSKIANSSNEVNISQCPGLNEFVNVYKNTKPAENSTVIHIEDIIPRLMDFDIHAALDISQRYQNLDKEDGNESLLTSHLINNVGLPKYSPVTIKSLYDLLINYFSKEYYLIKIINKIYPHAKRNLSPEKQNGVHTIYVQHIPKNVTEVLELIAEGKDYDEIINVMYERIGSDITDKTAKKVLASDIVRDLVIKNQHGSVNFGEIAKVIKGDGNKIKLLKNTLQEPFRELNKIKAFTKTIINGFEFNGIDRETASFFEQFKSMTAIFTEFAKTIDKKYAKKPTNKGFMQFLADSLKLCYSAFEIDSDEKRGEFLRQFIATIDSKKRLRFSDGLKERLSKLDYTVKDDDSNEIAKICSPSAHDPVQLGKFLKSFGKSCLSMSGIDRLSKTTYISVGLVVLKYVQTEISKILFNRLKSREVTIFFDE